jgi:hypothetical protein
MIPFHMALFGLVGVSAASLCAVSLFENGATSPKPPRDDPEPPQDDLTASWNELKASWNDLTTPPKPKAKPLYVTPPKAVKPADLVYGHKRQLIEAQRARLGGEATYTPSALEHERAANDALEHWFEDYISKNPAPVPGHITPMDVWVLDYIAFCDSHGYPKLSDENLAQAITLYARSHNCALTADGGLTSDH